ncbi:MAG: hypothetical protein EHM42_05925 [Planctomycetaceae bacterium]|nr:MAG: hypothetical protein EHM42_05925 [Planctomycetaceae bacterium]
MPRRSRKTSDLATWLGTSRTPLFVLDAERRIRVFNAGCQSLTGWSAADVVGEVCQYASVADVTGGSALAASLCPPPEAIAGQEISVPAHLAHRDGHTLARRLYFFPLHDDQRQLTGILGLVGDWQDFSEVSSANPAHRLHAELAAMRGALRKRFGLQALVASSLPMKRVLVQAELALSSRVFGLLQGEPGTGREHLARVIHFAGVDKQHWFVPLDCRRLSAAELERVFNRLLEVHKGPAPGAALPQPGTLYLSDVDGLPRDLQQRLCEFFDAAGISRSRTLRLLASTSRPLEELVASGSVRADFAAMISPLILALPPLRERPEDLPLLAQHFLEEFNRQADKQVAGYADDVMELLERYHWPRNLDELWEVIRDAHAAATGPLVTRGDLPYRLRESLAAQQLPPPPVQAELRLDPILTEIETRLIRQALKRSKNNRSKAAEILGIHRTRLIRRIEQLGLGESTGDSPATGQPVEADSSQAQPTDGPKSTEASSGGAGD